MSTYKAKIYYHHTDSGGVVYYGTYLSFLEEARTAYLGECGIDIRAFIEQGRFFVVSRQELDYRNPARYGDTLDVQTQLNGCSGVRIDLAHSIFNQRRELIAQARTVLAFVDTSFKPRPLPLALRQSLEAVAPKKGPDA